MKTLAHSPGPDAAGGEASGRDMLDHREPHRPLGCRATDVFGARGVAIHRGVGPGGNVERADDIFGEYAAEGVVERDAEGGLAGNLGEDAAGGVRRRDGIAHGLMGQRPFPGQGGEELEPHRVLEPDHHARSASNA